MHQFNLEETVSTLRFAQRAKAITTTVSVNQRRSVEELEALVAQLTRELEQGRVYIGVLERELLAATPGAMLDELRKGVVAGVAAAKGSSASKAVVTPLAAVGAATNDEVVDELRELVATLEYELGAARTRGRDLEQQLVAHQEELAAERQQQQRRDFDAQQLQLQLQTTQLSLSTAQDRHVCFCAF